MAMALFGEIDDTIIALGSKIDDAIIRLRTSIAIVGYWLWSPSLSTMQTVNTSHRGVTAQKNRQEAGWRKKALSGMWTKG